MCALTGWQGFRHDTSFTDNGAASRLRVGLDAPYLFISILAFHFKIYRYITAYLTSIRSCELHFKSLTFIYLSLFRLWAQVSLHLLFTCSAHSASFLLPKKINSVELLYVANPTCSRCTHTSLHLREAEAHFHFSDLHFIQQMYQKAEVSLSAVSPDLTLEYFLLIIKGRTARSKRDRSTQVVLIFFFFFFNICVLLYHHQEEGDQVQARPFNKLPFIHVIYNLHVLFLFQLQPLKDALSSVLGTNSRQLMQGHLLIVDILTPAVLALCVDSRLVFW